MLSYGVDVGSVRRPGGFSWAAIDPAGEVRAAGKDDPAALAAHVVGSLSDAGTVAVAFESPLSVPVPVDWQNLGRGRSGEGGRPWSAGAGTGALATGLVQAAWVCRYISAALPGLEVTTQLERFGSARIRLLIAEALVAADGKPEPVGGDQDYADAIAAARRLSTLIVAAERSDVRCAPAPALNLAAAVAMFAGLGIARDELGLDVLVAKAQPFG